MGLDPVVTNPDLTPSLFTGLLGHNVSLDNLAGLMDVLTNSKLRQAER